MKEWDLPYSAECRIISIVRMSYTLSPGCFLTLAVGGAARQDQDENH